MRSKIVMKNIHWALIYQVSTLLLGFLTPRFILLAYGSEINGLQSTILQIIHVMTLLQAGTISAVVFLLYEPIAHEKYDIVAVYMSSAIKFFKRVALIFGGLMITGAIIFSLTLHSSLSHIELFTAFFVFGLKSTFDILFVSKYLIIFTANQNKYIISIANLFEKLVYYLLIFVCIAQKVHFIWMYVGLVVACLVKITIYRIVYFNNYRNLIDLKKQYPYKSIRGRNYSMLNEVSHSIVASSISIFYSYLFNLKISSVFSVYNLVIMLLTMVGIVIYDSFGSSFGNLIAEKGKKVAKNVFQMFQMGFTMINTVLYMTAAYMIIPFVKIYTSGIQDIPYVNYPLAIMIILYGIIYTYRIPYNILVSANGLFAETSTQPVISCCVSLILSLVLGKWEMELVLVGPITFYLTNYIYQRIKLKKFLSDIVPEKEFLQVFVTGLGVVASLIISYIFPFNKVGIIAWGIGSIITAIISCIYVMLVYFLFDKKLFINTVKYIKDIILRRG